MIFYSFSGKDFLNSSKSLYSNLPHFGDFLNWAGRNKKSGVGPDCFCKYGFQVAHYSYLNASIGFSEAARLAG